MTVRVQPAEESDRLLIRFPFSRDLVARIRSVPGRRWHPEERCWSVPRSRRTAERLVARFDRNQLEVATELAALFPDGATGSPPARDRDLLRRMREELRLRGYGARTRKNYLGHARRFLDWTGGAPLEPTDGEARRYLLHLLEEKEVSHAYASQCVSALKFLFGRVLDGPCDLESLPRPRPDRKLPVVLSRREVLDLLNSVRNLKHRTILLLTYSAGLRVGEVVRLRVEDIDPDRGLIHVRRAKGKKDRYVMLSEVAWTTLRTYTRIHRPARWLFPGGRPGRHLTARSVQKVVERARERAGIRKAVSPHSLRHAFATHLLEAGTDLRYIQELLGHASSRTTEIYTRVTRRDLARIRSPLDDLEAEKGGDGPRLRGPGEKPGPQRAGPDSGLGRGGDPRRGGRGRRL